MLAAFTAATAIYLRPFAAMAGDHLLPDRGDPLFNLYILQWTARQWSLGFADLWNAPFFFPATATLTLSDHLIGPGLLFLVVDRLVGNPIATYNLLLAAAFPATGVATYWFLRRSSASVSGSLIGAAALTFAPFRWMHLGHIQILLMPLTPLVLWTFDRLLVERTVQRGGLFLLTYLPHLAGGCYIAYMTHLPLAVLAFTRLWREPRDFLRLRTLALLGTVALVCGAAIAGLFLPYARAAERQQRERRAPEISTNAASAKSFFTTSHRSRYQPLDLIQPEHRRRSRDEQGLFPGIAAVLLAPVGLVAWLKSRRSRRHAAWEAALLVGAAVALVLTFATPYLLAARVLPGLSGMRVPARFVAVAWPAFALQVALGADALQRPLGRRLRSLLAALLFALVLVAEAPRPVRWVKLETPAEIPALHHWLGSPEASAVQAVVELPLQRNALGTLAMHRSTVHWKPIANGFSGYQPPTFIELADSFRRFPGAPAFAILRRQGITHLMAPRLRGRETWEREFLGREIELTRSEGGWRLYRVLPTAPVAVQAGG
jgi:hypothetical protein